MSIKWELWSDEEQEAHRNHPDEIAYREYQDRAISNERLHCLTCGRFVKPLQSVKYYNGSYTCEYTAYNCGKCGEGRIEWV
jgi:hypothetical protein